MPARPGRRLKSLLRSAIESLVDRILGDDAEDGWERLNPGDVCTTIRSIVGANNGVLLKGSMVEYTGVQDPKGRVQIRVADIPDEQWTETGRLPYGPGFVLYIEPQFLRKIVV